MNKARFARSCETLIPMRGDIGGPLCGVTANYEDGTSISFNHIVIARYSKERDEARAEVDRLKEEYREKVANTVALSDITNQAAWSIVEDLKEEISALKLQLSGRTYCHSDEAVNEELATLKADAELLSIWINRDDPGNYPSNIITVAKKYSEVG